MSVSRVPDLSPHSLRPLVHWKDLVPLRGWEQLWELSLSCPWLLAGLWAYSHARLAALCTLSQALWLLLGALASFFFFLTGLRQSHNAQHSCLGIGRRGHHAMLFLLSLLMHAIRVTHLHHHRHCLHDEDEEARQAAWPWWRVLVAGPYLIVRLHLGAWRLARASDRRWIAAELLGAMLLLLVAVALAPAFLASDDESFLARAGRALRWHAVAMLTGECLTSFFAVWIVHHGCESGGQIARTQRGWMKNLLSYSMFYHLEHHLWPAVPICHLPELAKRLDAAEPAVGKQVM